MKLMNKWFLLLSLLCLFGCNQSPNVQTTSKPKQEVAVNNIKKGDLIRAVYSDDLTTVKSLLAQGADINENIGTAGQEITPLLVAVALGREAVAYYLIERGAALHSQYRGYKPEIFSIHVLGDSSRVTQNIRREGRSVISEGEKNDLQK